MEVEFDQDWRTQSEDDELRLAELNGDVEATSSAQKAAKARFLRAFSLEAVCFIACLAAIYERRLLADNLTAVLVLDAFCIGGATRFFLNARYRLHDAERKGVEAVSQLNALKIEVSAKKPTYVEIRRILLEVWDPIGVRDEPLAQDEYDRYIPNLYNLLEGNALDSDVEDYLNWIATERMGFTKEQIQTTKQTIAALKLASFTSE